MDAVGDHLPGHAHSDILSVLLEFRGEQILADTGVYEYAEGVRRTYSRSTAAHNTVQLDHLEQGDFWKSFRVGKRGHPENVQVTSNGVAAEHTGFSIWKNGLKHQRTLHLRANGFEVIDLVRGPAEHRIEATYHFAPGTRFVRREPHSLCTSSGLAIEVSGIEAQLATSEYYPEFGYAEQRECLMLSGRFRRRREFRLKCTYSS